MKIIADKEAHEAIKQLCDVALKHGGLPNHQAVAIILNSIQPLEHPKDKENGAKDDNSGSKGDTTD